MVVCYLGRLDYILHTQPRPHASTSQVCFIAKEHYSYCKIVANHIDTCQPIKTKLGAWNKNSPVAPRIGTSQHEQRGYKVMIIAYETVPR